MSRADTEELEQVLVDCLKAMADVNSLIRYPRHDANKALSPAYNAQDAALTMMPKPFSPRLMQALRELEKALGKVVLRIFKESQPRRIEGSPGRAWRALLPRGGLGHAAGSTSIARVLRAFSRLRTNRHRVGTR